MTSKSTLIENPLLRNPDVVLREEDADGALLFNPDTSRIRVINRTGLFIWKRCNGKNGLADIVSALKKAYARVPAAEVAGQVKTFVDDMGADGFLAAAAREKKTNCQQRPPA